MRSWSAWTRSGAARGPGRSASAPPCCRRASGCTRSATRRCSPRPSASGSSIASRRGARRGRSATPARTSATSWACRPRSGWPRSAPSTASASTPDKVLLDGRWDFVGGATRIVKGDAKCLSIAAASILAKVTRDRIMREESIHYPGLRLRTEQGLPVPPPQDGAQGVGPHIDSPPHVGVHGPPALVRHPRRSPPIRALPGGRSRLATCSRAVPWAGRARARR